MKQMAPGGQWFVPSSDGGVPVYVPAKQLEAHRKRLIAEDGWTPIPDPRKEEDQQQSVSLPANAPEVAMQARIDQLEAMVRQLLTQNSEQANGSQINDVSSHFQSEADGQRPKRGKPAV